MTEHIQIIGIGTLATVCIALVGICFKLSRDINNHLSHKVDNDTCHAAQENTSNQIKGLGRNMDNRFEDLHRRLDDIKDLIRKNGK